MAAEVTAKELANLDASTDRAVFLNLIERLVAEVQALREELGLVRDENNRLKGEQGRPSGGQKKRQRLDRSSERERREQAKVWHKRAELPEIVVDRQVECRLDPADLPPDARLKDHVDVTVQDLVLRTDNVRFHCERWYAASTGTTYQAPLPPGYEGAFGPGLKALALTLGYGANVGQAQIRRLFARVGVQVSAGYLAGLLTNTDGFAPEAHALAEAGLACDGYVHIDVTPTRVAGGEQECHVLGNTAFVFYHTDRFRDRQAALRALRLGAPSTFQVNEAAWTFLATGARLAASTRVGLETLPANRRFTPPAWYGWLDTNLPWLGPQQRQRLSDAAAIGAYRAQTAVPVVNTLVRDDAPAFKGLTEDLQLCWVHEGRHYKKLTPVIPRHQALLARFLTDFWVYYRRLRACQAAPSLALAGELGTAFDTLFRQRTGYADLDERISKTKAKRQALLRVLEKPSLPLHNNPAELAARRRVRKRDASFGARSPAGIRAWDVFHTLIGPHAFDFRCRDDAAMRDRFLETRAQGGLVSINHPFDPGCGWHYSFDLPYEAIEIWNGRWNEHNAQALGFWQEQLVAGRRLIALGGTDFHRLPPSLLRIPVATRLWVTERSETALLDAMRRGRAIVTGGVDVPQVRFTIDEAPIGDTVGTSGDQAQMTIGVEATGRCLLRLISNRGVEMERTIAGVYAIEQTMAADRRFYRLEVWSMTGERRPLALTNPIFLQR